MKSRSALRRTCANLADVVPLKVRAPDSRRVLERGDRVPWGTSVLISVGV